MEVTAKIAALAWPGPRSVVPFLRWNDQIPVKNPTVEKITDMRLFLQWVDDDLRTLRSPYIGWEREREWEGTCGWDISLPPSLPPSTVVLNNTLNNYSESHMQSLCSSEPTKNDPCGLTYFLPQLLYSFGVCAFVSLFRTCHLIGRL